MENLSSTPVEPGFIKNYMDVTPTKYCLLYVVTLGFYGLYFQYKLSKLMAGLKMEGETEKLIFWANSSISLRLIYLATGIVFTLMEAENLYNLSQIFWVGAVIFEVLWSFKARSILSYYIADKYKVLINANGLLLFFCPGFSLTMMFNSIEREIALLKALRGQ